MQYRPSSAYSTPPVVKNLILINVVMLALTWVVANRFNVDLKDVLGLYYPGSSLFRPYQIATHMFMHGGLPHLFFNMFALWMFGRILENVWGGKRFLFYYFATGLGAVGLHTLVNWIELSSVQHAVELFASNPNPDAYAAFISKYVDNPNPAVYSFIRTWVADPQNTSYIHAAVSNLNNYLTGLMNIPTVGASGAVYGVLLAFGMLFPNTQLMFIFPPIPVKAKWVVIFYAGLEVWLGITQPGSSIAHFAHIGGMLFGFILIRYWNRKKNSFY